MASSWILAFVLTAAAVCTASNVSNRIVGGAPTTVETYPTIVQVDSLGIFSGAWGQSCAATILNNLYILSAAHCFDGWTYRLDWRRIRAGATMRNTGGEIIYLERVINHPSYGTLGLDGDISVVRLQSSLVYNNAIQQAPIINHGGVLPDNTPVVHAGWGAVSQGGAASSQLLDVTIYTVNSELCTQRYLEAPRPGIVTDNMICAGILDVGGKDACQGDSGGPLYYTNILVGVVSWGEGCASSYWPGVSTRVASYTNWILENAV